MTGIPKDFTLQYKIMYDKQANIQAKIHTDTNNQ